jgi:Zn-dependent protease
LFPSSLSELLSRIPLVILLLLSLCVHEWAHAWSAYRLGDDTAARMGRLTLNPFAHADLFGTILLPLLGIPFGWAKPVPIDASRFRRSVRVSTGTALTAAAGPLANVVMAVTCSVAYALILRFSPEIIVGPTGTLLGGLIRINVTLALFNLIPVPPLDGSRIVDGLIPLRLRSGWEAFSRFAPFLLIAVIFMGGRIIAGPATYVLGLLQALINTIA